MVVGENGSSPVSMLVGEKTMFLLDPCGNALEFKAFKDIGQLFAK